jgi:hypothetical protein
MHEASSCQGLPDREQVTVDGASGVALLYERTDCTHDHHVIVVATLHGSMAYVLLWLVKRGEDDVRREVFESILSTWEWAS